MNTLWQRITFNAKEQRHSDITDVTSAREQFASLINYMDEKRNQSEEPDVKRLASIAITKLEEACMFFIKTLTYNQ